MTNENSIRIDDKGNYILSPEALKNLIDLVDELDQSNTEEPQEEAIRRKHHYCCVIKPQYEDTIVAKKGYKEYTQEIATFKCDMWAKSKHPGARNHLENTRCENIAGPCGDIEC